MAGPPLQTGQCHRVPTVEEAAVALPTLSLPDLEIVLQILQEEKCLQDMENVTPGSVRFPTATPTRHPYSGTTCPPDETQDMPLDDAISMGEPEHTSQREVMVTSQPSPDCLE